jgi:anti-sigma B factor antagonist
VITLQTEEIDGRYVVKVGGEVDVHTSPELAAELTRLFGESIFSVDVDLHAVEFLDSTGLAVLLSAHRDAEKAGGALRVFTSSDRIRKLLRISGLIDTLNVIDSTSEGTSFDKGGPL